MTDAGFARRYAAWSLDAVLVAAIAAVLAWPRLAPAWHALSMASAALVDVVAGALFDGLLAGDSLAAIAAGLLHDERQLRAVAAFRWGMWHVAWPFLLAYAAVALPWHATGVASAWQAPPGKRFFGLVVVGPGGSRPSATRAVGRHLAAALSWLTLNLGHVAALGQARAALHDRVAGTRVRRRADAPARTWCVAAWIAIQGLAVVVLAWWLAGAVAGLAAGRP